MSFCSVSGLARAATISGHATRSQGPADGPDEFLFFVFVIFVCVGVTWCHWSLLCRKGMMKMTQARVGMRWNLRVSHLSESSKYHPKIQDHWTARMESIDVNRTYWSYCAILRHVCVRLADATVINSQVCFPVTVFRIRLNSKQGKGSDQPFLWESLLMLRARARARVASCYHVVSCCIQSIQK